MWSKPSWKILFGQKVSSSIPLVFMLSCYSFRIFMFSKKNSKCWMIFFLWNVQLFKFLMFVHLFTRLPCEIDKICKIYFQKCFIIKPSCSVVQTLDLWKWGNFRKLRNFRDCSKSGKFGGFGVCWLQAFPNIH